MLTKNRTNKKFLLLLLLFSNIYSSNSNSHRETNFSPRAYTIFSLISGIATYKLSKIYYPKEMSDTFLDFYLRFIMSSVIGVTLGLPLEMLRSYFNPDNNHNQKPRYKARSGDFLMHQIIHAPFFDNPNSHQIPLPLRYPNLIR